MESALPTNERFDIDVPVDLAAIPQQHDMSVQMAQEQAEKRQDLHMGEVVVVEADIQPHAMTPGRHGEPGNHRDFLAPIAVPQQGGLPDRGLGFVDVGNEQETTFIEEDQMGPKSLGFFYPRPCPPFPSFDGFLVPLDGPPLRLLATPFQARHQVPNVAGMVAYAEVFLDQPGHAFQGPDLCGIAVRLRPFQQEAQQCSLLRLGQTRRTPPGRLGVQPVPSFLAVGLTPADHRAQRGVQRRRDRTKTFSGLQESHRLMSTFLQLLGSSIGSHALQHSSF